MKRCILAIALFIATVPAWALDTSVLLYGAAYHFDGHMKHERQYKLNEANPGIGLEVESNGWLAGAGVYEDSFYKWAKMAYAGYRYTIGDAKQWHANIALKAGYLNGSGYNGFVALPTLGVGYGHVSLEATAFPSKVRKGGVIAAWLRYQF